MEVHPAKQHLPVFLVRSAKYQDFIGNQSLIKLFFNFILTGTINNNLQAVNYTKTLSWKALIK